LSRPRNRLNNGRALSLQPRERTSAEETPVPEVKDGLKSRLDFGLEVKAGYRYLHVREMIHQDGMMKQVRCSRDLVHIFHRDDLSFADWEALNKGACVSVRIRDWQVSEINVIGSGGG